MAASVFDSAHKATHNVSNKFMVSAFGSDESTYVAPVEPHHPFFGRKYAYDVADKDTDIVLNAAQPVVHDWGCLRELKYFFVFIAFYACTVSFHVPSIPVLWLFLLVYATMLMAYPDGHHIYSVLEYAPEGNLYQKLRRVGSFDESTTRKIVQ